MGRVGINAEYMGEANFYYFTCLNDNGEKFS